MAGAGAGADQSSPGSPTPGAAGGGDPEERRDWAGLPEHLLMKIATKHVAQTEAGWAARLEERGCSDLGIQYSMVMRKRDGNCQLQCLFVFALVCKEWRKAQLKVGGRLRTRVHSDVLLPGRVALVKWALAEGCPREKGGFTMASAAAQYGHMVLAQWLIQEQGFAMDEHVLGMAARGGNLELVQWLRGEGCPWDHGTCWWAVAYDQGHVEVLRWARENGCPWIAATRDLAEWKLGYTDDLGNLVDFDGNPVQEIG